MSEHGSYTAENTPVTASIDVGEAVNTNVIPEVIPFMPDAASEQPLAQVHDPAPAQVEDGPTTPSALIPFVFKLSEGDDFAEVKRPGLMNGSVDTVLGHILLAEKIQNESLFSATKIEFDHEAGYPVLKFGLDTTIAEVSSAHLLPHAPRQETKARLKAGVKSRQYRPVLGRPTLNQYKIRADPAMMNHLGGAWDPRLHKLWASQLGIRSEADSIWLYQSRLRAAAMGDNHLYLLVRAFMYYYDLSLASCSNWRVQRLASYRDNAVINVVAQADWLERVKGGNVEIVSAPNSNADFVSFWAACASPDPIYGSVLDIEGSGNLQSPFSSYRFNLKSTIIVLSTGALTVPSSGPDWAKSPALILSHIDTYVRRLGLEVQARDALNMVANLPSIAMTTGIWSVPEPCHTQDWFEEFAVGIQEYDDLKLLSSTPVAMQLIAIFTAATIWELGLQNYWAVCHGPRAMPTDARDGVSAVQSSLSLQPLHRIGYTVGLARLATHSNPRYIGLFGIHEQLIDWVIRHSDTVVPKGELWPHFFVPQRVGFTSLVRDPFTLQDYTVASTTVTASYNTTVRFRSLGVSGDKVFQHDMVNSTTFPATFSGRIVTGVSRSKTEFLVRASSLRVHLIIAGVPYGIALPEEQSKSMYDFAALLAEWAGGPVVPISEIMDTGADANITRALNLADTLDLGQKVSEQGQRALQLSAEQAADHLVVYYQQMEKSLQRILDTNATTVTAQSAHLALIPGMIYDAGGQGDCGWQALAAAAAQVGVTRSPRTWRRSLLEVGGRFTDTATSSGILLRLAAVNCGITCTTISELGLITSSPKVGDSALLTIMLINQGGHWGFVGFESQSSSSSGNQKDANRPSAEFECPGAPVEPTRRYTYSKLTQAIRDLKCGRTTREVVARMHTKVFPRRELPRFLRPSYSPEPHLPPSGKTGCGCYACGGVASPRSRAQFCADCTAEPVNSEPFGSSLIQLASAATLKPDDFERLDTAMAQLYPYRSPETSNKNNFNVTMLFRLLMKPSGICKSKARWVLLWLANRVGQDNETVAPIGLWLLTNTISSAAMGLLHIAGLFTLCCHTWLDKAKDLHDTLRKTGTCAGSPVSDQDLAQMLYLQSLYGRGGVEIDWAEELSKRVVEPQAIQGYFDGKWSEQRANLLITQAIEKTLQQSRGPETVRSFDVFMEDAYEWLVSGSSAGIPSVLKASEARDHILKELGLSPRPTKRSVMEAIPREKILAILDQKPVLLAKAHMKLNETGGKARAIYGVAIWHYIYSNWVMAPYEKTCHAPEVDINLPNDQYCKQLVDRQQWAAEGKVISSYDYPDFNAMHRYSHMAKIYEVAKRLTLAKTTLTGTEKLQVAKAYDWLIKSCEYQVVFDPRSSVPVKCAGGLFSGNRDTTLINTVLNIAYASVVDNSVIEMGLQHGAARRLCHGDDIITLFDSYTQAVVWNEVAEKARLGGQETKLLVDESYHEYLRIFGCRDGTLRGSLARSCASFANGNWETNNVIGAKQVATEFISSLQTLYRRGADKTVIDNLLRVAMVHKLSEVVTAAAAQSMADVVWNAPKTVGGLGIPTVDGTLSEVTISTDSPTVDDEVRNTPLVDKLDLPMELDNVTEPYLAKQERRLPSWAEINPRDRVRLKRTMQLSTLGTELPVSKQDLLPPKEASRQLLAVRKGLGTIIPGPQDKHNPTIEVSQLTKAVRQNKEWSALLRRYDSLKTVLAYVTIAPGFAKADLVAHMLKIPVDDALMLVQAREQRGVVNGWKLIPELQALSWQLLGATAKHAGPQADPNVTVEITHNGGSCSNTFRF